MTHFFDSPDGTASPMPQDIAHYEFEGKDGQAYHVRIRIFWPQPEHAIILTTEYAQSDIPPAMYAAYLYDRAAQIATDVRRVTGITDLEFTWIEHHDDRKDETAMVFGHPDRPEGESFTLVEFDSFGSTLHSPRRSPISKAETEHLIGQTLD